MCKNLYNVLFDCFGQTPTRDREFWYTNVGDVFDWPFLNWELERKEYFYSEKPLLWKGLEKTQDKLNAPYLFFM